MIVARPIFVVVALLSTSTHAALRSLGKVLIDKACAEVKAVVDLTGIAECDCTRESVKPAIGDISCTSSACLLPPIGPIPGICGKFCARRLLPSQRIPRQLVFVSLCR
jgi:hypothetical protein